MIATAKVKKKHTTESIKIMSPIDTLFLKYQDTQQMLCKTSHKDILLCSPTYVCELKHT